MSTFKALLIVFDEDSIPLNVASKGFFKIFSRILVLPSTKFNISRGIAFIVKYMVLIVSNHSVK